MLRHQDIWRAIDRLAEAHGMSPSGLARKAGLDATTFNKSKRILPNGNPRWPSTESLSKILAATGATIGEFSSYMELHPSAGVVRNIPLLGFAEAGADGFFDDAGYPMGSGWDEIPFPDFSDSHAYALEVSGESMLPVYRDGDIIVVSPASSVRRGDRVVLKTVDGEVMAKQLRRHSAKQVELLSINPEFTDRTLRAGEVQWLHRITWVSQ